MGPLIRRLAKRGAGPAASRRACTSRLQVTSASRAGLRQVAGRRGVWEKCVNDRSRWQPDAGRRPGQTEHDGGRLSWESLNSNWSICTAGGGGAESESDR